MSSCPAPIRSPPRSRPPADLAADSASLRAAVGAGHPSRPRTPSRRWSEVDVVAARNPVSGAGPGRSSAALSPQWPRPCRLRPHVGEPQRAMPRPRIALAGFSDAPVQRSSAPSSDEQPAVPQFSAPAPGGGSRKSEARRIGDAEGRAASKQLGKAPLCKISGGAEGRQPRRLLRRAGALAAHCWAPVAHPHEPCAAGSTDARAATARVSSRRFTPGSPARRPAAATARNH